MPDTPLNPDALEAASRAIDPEAWEVVDKHRGDPGAERLCASLTSEVAAQVSAYLAVAQPEVNSVEELDALPLGTIIEDSDDDCVLQALERGSIMGTEWYIPGVEKIFTSKDVELPARVLYRPEVKP